MIPKRECTNEVDYLQDEKKETRNAVPPLGSSLADYDKNDLQV